MDTITKKQDFTRCTGTSDKKQADSIAQEWLVNGVPGKSASSNIDRKISFCDYLHKFWDFDTSEYFREQETMGKEPHAEHALDMQRIVERYYRPYFQSKLLCQIDEESLQAFLVYLKTQKHLAASTVNSARNASIKALRYSKRKRIIKHFDFDIILRAGGKAAKRGTLEKEEVDKLFSLEWPSIRARIAALIAYYTGMRMGEIRALRICDVHPDKISVKHSWGRISKQKSTKNQEIRNIPILPILYEEIMAYIKEMDLNRIDGLLIPAKNPENPYDYRRIEKEFYRMLEKIGIDEKTRMEKNIVFHSFRHLLAKNLVENGTNKTIAMKILGHKTAHIFDMYADHVDKETFNQMAKAIENVSKNETPKEPIPFLRAV
jgi:integrase